MTRRDLALSLLQDAGPRGVETGEFLRAGVGSRYGARLLELRKQGHRIESERIRDGAWRYVLDESPDPESYGHDPHGWWACAAEGCNTKVEVCMGRCPKHQDDALFAFPDAYEELRAKDVA